MTHKSTMHITTLTQTGLKIFIVILIISNMTGCGWIFWDKEYDYDYRIMMENKTNDTLFLVLNDSLLIDTIYGYTLLPHDTTSLEDGRSLNKGQDVIEALFSDGKHEYYNIASIFRHDSLLIKWEGTSFKSDSIHHFFNYNSWDSWLINDNEGIIMFSINELDLK